MSLLSDNPLAIAITIVVFLVLGFFIIRAVRKHNKKVKEANDLTASLKVSYAEKLKAFIAEFPDHDIYSEGYLYGSHYEIFLISSKKELKMNLTDYSLEPRGEKDARALKMLRSILKMRFDKYDVSIEKREALREVWIELHRKDKEQNDAKLMAAPA